MAMLKSSNAPKIQLGTLAQSNVFGFIMSNVARDNMLVMIKFLAKTIQMSR